jgi:hypothetical protein
MPAHRGATREGDGSAARRGLEPVARAGFRTGGEPAVPDLDMLLSALVREAG